MKARAETTIERPAEEVFAFVADPANDPQWCPNVRSVQQASGDGPGEGARYEVVHTPTGKPVQLSYEILELEPPRHLLMRQEDDMGTFLTTYELEPAGEGRTRIVQRSEMRFKGLARIAAPVISLLVRKGNRDQFARLKALLEAEENGRAGEGGGSA